MDWLFSRQARIEKRLAKQHLSNGTLVLYDVSSTYFEGRCCPLAHLGHSRDERPGNLQIVFGMLTNADGCPVAVEVFEGNTADPSTLSSAIAKLRNLSSLPLAVGFGVSSPESAKEAASKGDAVVVASTVLKVLLDGQGMQEALEKARILIEAAHAA